MCLACRIALLALLKGHAEWSQELSWWSSISRRDVRSCDSREAPWYTPLCAVNYSSSEALVQLSCFWSLDGSFLGQRSFMAAAKPVLYAHAVDGRTLFLIHSRRKYEPLVLSSYDPITFRELGRLDLTNGLTPTALLGFEDLRVFVAYGAKYVAFIDLGRKEQHYLVDDWSEARLPKAIDHFAYNGQHLLAAVDDFLTPKWMLTFNATAPRYVSAVHLPDGVNEAYVAALFVAPLALVVLSGFQHMAGHGSGLYFITLEPTWRNVSYVSSFELMEWEASEPEWCWIEPFSSLENLALGIEHLIISARQRGLLLLERAVLPECFSAQRDELTRILESGLGPD